MVQKRRRSIDERIADQERELRQLKSLRQIETFDEALKAGQFSGSRGEFSTRLRELRLVNRAIQAAERHDEPILVKSLEEFHGKLAKSMADLVTEG